MYSTHINNFISIPFLNIMMKIEELIKYNDAEASENFVEEFDRLKAQSSIQNPKLYLFIVLSNNNFFLILIIYYIKLLKGLSSDICIFISFLLNILLSFIINLSQLFKYNSLIFLLFSKNDISEMLE